ncbi:MAG TPA: ATP-binding protein [Nitrospirae bacterium]|nr:ATPase family associated with various cellular activities [bacterium BMS3Abin08]HDO36510.1 ATP-binding protein [Nitrospirota bacterium]
MERPLRGYPGVDDMDELVRQLRELNTNFRRFLDQFRPVVDLSVLDRYVAFKVFPRGDQLMIEGIDAPDPVTFDELKGIDEVVTLLKRNTMQFLRGLPCNDVLIYGPRGTGKSSAVKAVLNKYRDEGLRMIEVDRAALLRLHEILGLIRGRKEHFIVFCDDLTFHEEENAYIRLKAVLEGGLETRADNLLIYATSNRRHLMPERVSDNTAVYSDGELHPSESVEERVSLSDRFGLRIGLVQFDVNVYLDIVRNYVRLRKIEVGDNELLRKRALQWATSHGSFSGRTARQFADDLEGRERLGPGDV